MRFLLAFWVLTSLSTIAQTVTHEHLPVDVIDGSKTPELISDNTAWRLWLLSVTSEDPKHAELNQARQNAYLLNAGFAESDLPVLRQVLRDFKRAYDSMIEDHNSLVTAGLNPSLLSLKTRRDLLVNGTQESLLAVRAERVDKVKAFIKGEKKRMRVSEVQP